MEEEVGFASDGEAGLSRRLSLLQRSEAALLRLADGEGERRGGIEGSDKSISLAGHGGDGGGVILQLLPLPLLRRFGAVGVVGVVWGGGTPS
jgi:hypothetical protein